MLKRRNLVHLPTYCVVALLALFVTGMAVGQAVAQAPCTENAPYPRTAPCPPHSQVPCDPYRCCESCPPNFRYWGYWPTTWRQWPQRHPGLEFPQGVGLEPLPAPQGTVPEPLPKEEPFISPTAPGDGWLPPVGEGPATGPGEPDLPFDFDRGLDQGPGFDQNLPGVENLPAEQPSPMTLPIEGTEGPGAAPPALPDIPTPPATETPAPGSDSSTQSNRLSPLAGNDIKPGDIKPGDIKPEDIKSEDENPHEPAAPQPGDTCLASVATPEPIAANEQSPPMPKTDDTIRRTAFESPVEKTGKSNRAGGQPPLPKTDEIDLSTPAPEPRGHDGPDEPRASIGLDGYCPIALVRDGTWALGDPRFAAVFEGRTYLMSGPQQHRAFRSNPERYAPVDSGLDPVLSFEEDSRRLGRTDACAVFEGRLYMFSDADSLARFQSDPHRYTRVPRRK